MPRLSDKNKTLTERFFEQAFNQGDLSVVDELLSPKYQYNGHPSPPAGTKAWVEGLRTQFPGLHFTVEAILAEDDKVALRWRLDIPKGAAQPAGSLKGTNILTFADGQAVTNDQSGGTMTDFVPA